MKSVDTAANYSEKVIEAVRGITFEEGMASILTAYYMLLSHALDGISDVELKDKVFDIYKKALFVGLSEIGAKHEIGTRNDRS